MAFVLDNSVVSGWLLQGQATDYTEAVSRRMTQERAIAPALLVWEYTNVLRTACKRGRLTAQDAQQAITWLKQLPIDTDTSTPDAAMLLALALRHDLSSYDAVYLEVALRLQLPIATADTDLASAARVAGVGVLGD